MKKLIENIREKSSEQKAEEFYNTIFPENRITIVTGSYNVENLEIIGLVIRNGGANRSQAMIKSMKLEAVKRHADYILDFKIKMVSYNKISIIPGKKRNIHYLITGILAKNKEEVAEEIEES